MCLEYHGSVIFEENCSVKFDDNVANSHGGATYVYSPQSTNLIFSGHLVVMLNNNKVFTTVYSAGGALYVHMVYTVLL